MFKNLSGTNRYLAIKKIQSEVLKFIPIRDPEVVIYEVYCEIYAGQLPSFIIWLPKMTKTIDGIEILPELDGACPGREAIPCTFDGFAFITGDKERVIKELEDELKNFENKGQKVVKEIRIKEIDR